MSEAVPIRTFLSGEEPNPELEQYTGDVYARLPDGAELSFGRAVKEIYALRQIARDMPRKVYLKMATESEAAELAIILKEGRVDCGPDEFTVPIGQGAVVIQWGA